MGRILLTLFLVSSIVADSAWAADAPPVGIGIIQTLKGTASIERDDEEFPAAAGQMIYVYDILRTGKHGSIGIMLEDNTVLSLGPKSELAVDEYVYVPKDRKMSLLARMVTGTVEYIAGTIGRLAPESVRFETPKAILGIRGTRFLVGCNKNEALFVLLSDLDGNAGTLEVITEGGTQVIVHAEGSVTVSDPRLVPAAPQQMTPMQLLETFKDVWQARPEEPVHYVVYFEPGSSDLTHDSSGLIAKVLETLAKNRSTDLDIIGHADTQGPKELNAQLSLDRASEVRDLLVLEGIEESYLKVASHGEEDQLVKTPDEVAEPLNRRVEIIIK